MFQFPENEKKLKSRISSYMSSMKKEKREFDYISDGAGKRFIMFGLLFVLSDTKKSRDYFQWYTEEFPDDGPCDASSLLFWSLSLHRMDEEKQARFKLAEAMLSNLYLIPKVIGKPVPLYDMWHSSNYEEPDYVDWIPVEIISSITSGEIEWLKKHYYSIDFSRIRKRHIEIYKELDHDKGVEARSPLIEEADNLVNTIES